MNGSLGTFSAWIDRMPGSTPKLIVTGTVQVPTTGWSSRLEPASPQGINESVLILDLHLDPPSGVAGQAVSQVECRYEESPPRRDYTDVTVRRGPEETTVKIGETQ